MESGQPRAQEFQLAPIKGGAAYALRLEDDILTLAGEDGHAVLMLPREEAAKYLRFDRDLLKGRVIEFRLLGGLRTMRFRCGPAADAIVAWLPAPRQPSLQARHLLLFLAAAIGLALPPLRPAGALVLVAAVLSVTPLRQNLSLPVALITGAAALVSLFVPALTGAQASLAVPFLYGIVLGLAALEHLALAGPNSAVLAARLAAGKGGARHASRLVRGVAYAAGAASLAFLGVSVVLYLNGPINPAELPDPVIFIIAAAALGVPVPWLLTRARAPYGAALLIAQLLIAIITLYAWGLGTGLVGGVTLDYSRGVFSGALNGAQRPYFALPLLVLEVAFRAWFVRAAEREAAEAD